MKRSLTTSRLGLIVLAACALALVVAPAALSDKGGNGGKPSSGSSTSGSSLTLDPLDPDDGGANYGEQVTFNVSTSAFQPQVNAQCYQNGQRVYSEWKGFFPGSWFGQTFTLGPTPSWQGGAADCTARIVTRSRNGREIVHATTTFHVYP
jgi:hypothetical protein